MPIRKLNEYLLLIYRKAPLSYRSVDFTEVHLAPEKPNLGFMTLSVTETPTGTETLAPMHVFFCLTVLLWHANIHFFRFNPAYFTERSLSISVCF